MFPLSLTHLGPTAGPPMYPFEGRYLSLCQESRWTVHPLICITFWGVTQVCHRPWEPSETYFNPPALLLGGVASICFIYSQQQLEYSVPKDTWRKGGGERCCKSDARRPSGEKLTGFSSHCSQSRLSDSGTKKVWNESLVGLHVHEEI